MNPSAQLSSKLNDYLNRRIALSDLESWLVPRLPVYLDTPTSPAAELVAAFELCLAELHDGVRSERSLRNALSRYLRAEPSTWYFHSTGHAEDMTSTATDESATLGPPNQTPTWNIESAEVAA